MGIYLLGAGTLGCVVWPGTGITHSQGFYSPHVNVGPNVLHHLSTCLCMSVPPILLDECVFFQSLVSDFHTNFLTVLGVICFEIQLCFFLWLCREVKHVYLCLHLLIWYFRIRTLGF